ncbi:MAG TPA: hypothetical protein VIZ69_09195, partial [Thermoanaerobaculia bacterium]
MFDLERKRDRAEPASHSVLGLREPEEDGPEAPITRSFLGLAGTAAARAEPPPSPPSGDRRPGPPPPEFGSRRPSEEPVPDAPRELFDLERKSDQGFPVERGILISLAAHILFFLLLLYWPSGGSTGKSLFPTFTPHVSKIDEPFPIVFRSAPGPERESRNAREFSDRNRRAGGGDPSRPRSDTPFVPLRPGREGIAPRAGAIASSQPPPSASQQRGESRQGQVAPPPEKSAAQGENLFRQPAGAPSASSESGKLANLDQAIREAAKGVGAPG